MDVFLDSSFIVSCVMKRIDFIEELRGMGFRVLVPREVLDELKDLRLKDKTSRRERESIDIAFKMLEEFAVKKKTIGGRNVDDALVSKGAEGFYIATLDRGIKVRVSNLVVIDSARKGLKIERK